MCNMDIRFLIQSAGLKNWLVAEKMGISESYFSRMLRHELSDAKKMEIKAAVDGMRGGSAGE